MLSVSPPSRASRLDVAVCPSGDHAPCAVSLLDDGLARAWDAFVGTHEDGTIFHTTAWRNAVAQAFGHRPYYLIATRGREVAGVFPLFSVKSLLGGRMLVSVPYGVGGGILASDPKTAQALFTRAGDVADKERCRAIEMRSQAAVVPDLPVIDRYVRFERALPDRSEDVLGWLPRKARAAARNGRDKHGLKVAFGDEHLHEVWKLYTRSMHRLASLAYPESFFRALIEQTPGGHWVCLVIKERRPVAGLLTLHFGDRVLPYFIGATNDAKRYCAANFLYWSTMERAVREGFRIFDFGRSRKDNRGSCDFKRFNGFVPRPLAYQTYVPGGGRAPNLSPTNPKFRLVRAVWRHLPLGLTRTIGSRAARHVPG